MATRRSTTGCTECKRKRRKCEEGKPRCRRCTHSGEPCSYDYIQRPNSKPHLVRRTKPAPRPPSELLAPTSRDTGVGLECVTKPFSFPSASGGSAGSTNLRSFAKPSKGINRNLDPTILSGYADITGIFVAPSFSDSLSLIDSSYSASSFDQLEVQILHNTLAQTPGPGILAGRLSQFEDDEPEVIEDYDPEGIQALLRVVPTMDRNVKENTLPFVLQCYAQWTIVSIFEPLKIVHAIREQVVEQFSSEDTRSKTILMANVMNMFARHLTVDKTGMSIITHLASGVREKVETFITTPSSFGPAADKQQAMRILDNSLEIMTLQVHTRPLSASIQTVEDAAPVLRRAYPELLGQPLNLETILLDPELNLRHYASADILSCITTGRPTCLKYEVVYSADLRERLFQIEEFYGLGCLHGLSDQFTIIFAWIDSLCEVPGAGADTELISWIESEIYQVKFTPNQSEDPQLRICRMVVREGWRSAVLIYLYMALCGADSDDPRVVRVLKSFMRLVNGIKAGRSPDAFLIGPMAIVGVVAYKEQHRSTIRHRIRNVQECSVPGSAGYDIAMQLEDIWARTKDEARASVWSDLRMACFRVTGK